MSLTPPLKVGKLQTALHTKAKNSPDYRFYALYDKVYRRDVLAFAYVRSRNNGGVAGVDCQRFAAGSMAACRGLTARVSTISRSRDLSCGWRNCRKNSGRPRINPNRSN